MSPLSLLSRPICQPLLVFIVVFAVYLSNVHHSGAKDTAPALLIPISIIEHGTLDLRPLGPKNVDKKYWLQRKGERILSSYSPMSGIMAVPFFYVAKSFGFDLQRRAKRVAKIAASFYSALAVVFLLLLLNNFVSIRSALLLSGLFAFGTPVFSVLSRSLWEHTLSLPFLCAALCCLLRKRDGWAGFLFGLAVCSRYPVFIFAFPTFWYLSSLQRVARFVAGGVVPALLLLWYHYQYFGDPLAMFGVRSEGVDAFVLSGASLSALLGLMFSPGRGLFVYSPFLIFALFTFLVELSLEQKRLARFALAQVAVYLLLFSLWSCWWGGESFAYRIVVELLPFAFLLLGLGVSQIGSLSKVVLALLAAIAICIHSVGFYLFPCGRGRAASAEYLWKFKSFDSARCYRLYSKL